MHREDWNAVYINQDRILNSLIGLNLDVFLAGGTGLHRFVLARPYRYSEDLDFFFPALLKNKDVATVVKQMTDVIGSIPGASIEEVRRIKEEGAYRLWCDFEDNDEIGPCTPAVQSPLLLTICKNISLPSVWRNIFILSTSRFMI